MARHVWLHPWSTAGVALAILLGSGCGGSINPGDKKIGTYTLVANSDQALQLSQCLLQKGQGGECTQYPNPLGCRYLRITVLGNAKLQNECSLIVDKGASAPAANADAQPDQGHGLPIVCRAAQDFGCVQCMDLYGVRVIDTCRKGGSDLFKAGEAAPASNGCSPADAVTLYAQEVNEILVANNVHFTFAPDLSRAEQDALRALPQNLEDRPCAEAAEQGQRFDTRPRFPEYCKDGLFGKKICRCAAVANLAMRTVCSKLRTQCGTGQWEMALWGAMGATTRSLSQAKFNLDQWSSDPDDTGSGGGSGSGSGGGGGSGSGSGGSAGDDTGSGGGSSGGGSSGGGSSGGGTSGGGQPGDTGGGSSGGGTSGGGTSGGGSSGGQPGDTGGSSGGGTGGGTGSGGGTGGGTGSGGGTGGGTGSGGTAGGGTGSGGTAGGGTGSGGTGGGSGDGIGGGSGGTPPDNIGCVGSPLVLDLDLDGLELTSQEEGVQFDLLGHGPVTTAWVRDPNDALLALDRNGNGRIDDGTELFGEALGVDHRITTDGFQALSLLDQKRHGGNGNGRIEAGDKLFGKLLLWTDRNRDGVSQPGELRTLSQANIQQLQLTYTRHTAAEDIHGNQLTLQGRFQLKNGLVGKMIDVFFLFGDLRSGLMASH